MLKKFFVGLSLVVGMQVATATPRILIEDKQENFTQTETGWVILFKLSATNEELNQIANTALDLKDRLTIQFSEASSGLYDCIFTVNHQNHAEYVHKMLVSIGIEELEYNGQVQTVDAIIPILKNYQK